MLLTKTITKSEDIQIEIKTPAFYGLSTTAKKIMLCNDGSLVTVYGSYISKVENEPTSHYKHSLEDAIKMDQIPEDEFTNAYDAALKAFETSMFPGMTKPFAPRVVYPTDPINSFTEWMIYIDNLLLEMSKINQ